jgi:2-oxoisovalerate dehydrogenase E1 component alpha subunit
MRTFLEKRGLLGEADEERIREATKQRILDAIHEAEREAPKPPVETLFEGVYEQPLWQQREQLARLREELGEPPVIESEDEGGALP